MKISHRWILLWCWMGVLVFDLRVSGQDYEYEEEDYEQEEELPKNSNSKDTSTKSSDDVETTTGEHDDIFNPVNNLLYNAGQGNITGVIDQALAIRTPPVVRQMVTDLVGYVFGVGSMLGQAAAEVLMQQATADSQQSQQTQQQTQAVSNSHNNNNNQGSVQAVQNNQPASDIIDTRRQSGQGQINYRRPAKPARVPSGTRRRFKRTTTTTSTTTTKPASIVDFLNPARFSVGIRDAFKNLAQANPLGDILGQTSRKQAKGKAEEA